MLYNNWNMIIGISGKKQCGKDTVCTIFRALDVYYSILIKMSSTPDPVAFALQSLSKHDLCTRDIRSKWERHAFADNLKGSLAKILNIPVGYLHDEGLKQERSKVLKPGTDEYYTYRELLQRYGTEVGRSISPTIWIDSLMCQYDNECGSCIEYGAVKGDGMSMNRVTYEPYWIVPDVRFESEAKAIKDRGGLIIRINRDTGSTDTHISETQLDEYNGFDYIIDNYGTLEELIMQVQEFMFSEGYIQ